MAINFLFPILHSLHIFDMEKWDSKPKFKLCPPSLFAPANKHNFFFFLTDFSSIWSFVSLFFQSQVLLWLDFEWDVDGGNYSFSSILQSLCSLKHFRRSFVHTGACPCQMALLLTMIFHRGSTIVLPLQHNIKCLISSDIFIHSKVELGLIYNVWCLQFS